MGESSVEDTYAALGALLTEDSDDDMLEEAAANAPDRSAVAPFAHASLSGPAPVAGSTLEQVVPTAAVEQATNDLEAGDVGLDSDSEETEIRSISVEVDFAPGGGGSVDADVILKDLLAEVKVAEATAEAALDVALRAEGIISTKSFETRMGNRSIASLPVLKAAPMPPAALAWATKWAREIVAVPTAPVAKVAVTETPSAPSQGAAVPKADQLPKPSSQAMEGKITLPATTPAPDNTTMPSVPTASADVSVPLPQLDLPESGTDGETKPWHRRQSLRLSESSPGGVPIEANAAMELAEPTDLVHAEEPRVAEAPKVTIPLDVLERVGENVDCSGDASSIGVKRSAEEAFPENQDAEEVPKSCVRKVVEEPVPENDDDEEEALSPSKAPEEFVELLADMFTSSE